MIEEEEAGKADEILQLIDHAGDDDVLDQVLNVGFDGVITKDEEEEGEPNDESDKDNEDDEDDNSKEELQDEVYTDEDIVEQEDPATITGGAEGAIDESTEDSNSGEEVVQHNPRNQRSTAGKGVD